ncbi:hypothetical protein Pst134EA_032392 [Puccinia striiformis f. sp. tritici]|uniref:uncharacterized protein n=1 Tax=Puccinia striiformis f. sp. tritici TaxID=168172 RepID=UPI00200776B0|nr:uncharacterized protein Pst134EA_032392 [Puccinia striiformis f. sp. tritici]KAH9444302.1 hypothetical protein Pst134EA_032392 [Puccinia striiformis f. sp. tritici]
MSETSNLENPLLAVGTAGNNLPPNLGPYRDRVDWPDSSNHGLLIGEQLPAKDAREASPLLATHPYGTPAYAAEARAVPHFLESRITLPKYNPEALRTDFISRLEKAAQLNSAQGSDICLQIVFFMQGEALAKEVQEMVELENYDWEKLKERFVQCWGSMMPLLKHTRAELDTFIAIKLMNLVAYLLRCRQMTNIKDIRHALLTCIARPIQIAVTKELIRDNQMQQAIEGSHILPLYRIIMESAESAKNRNPSPSSAPSTPKGQSHGRFIQDSRVGTFRNPPGFTPASRLPYKSAQHNRPPSTPKWHYCFGEAYTAYRCNLYSQDKFEKKVYREGQDYMLPNGTSIHFDRSLPIKVVVDRYSAPASTPGIINLPPGTQVRKEEEEPGIQSSFGQLEECQPPKLATYESDAAKRLRNGKEIAETPNKKRHTVTPKKIWTLMTRL